MKRRDFLVASAGLTGAVIPILGHGQSRPCPPGTLSVSGGSNVVSNCQAGASAEADWIARSTGAGVIWAHDFSEDAELATFIRGTQAGNPLTLVGTDLGSARALRSRGYGSSITAATPSGVAGDLQWWNVANAANFPDPAGSPYTALVGDTGGIEYVKVHERDLATNRIRVARRADSSSLAYNGKSYTYPAAPSYAGNGTVSVGKGPDGSWNRPLGAFGAGDNGRSAPDIGLTNGAARKQRTWYGAGDTRHAKFREAYWGHRSYWNDAYAAERPAGAENYDSWLPLDALGREDGVRTKAFEGDEFYLQFRARFSPSKINNPRYKMLFIQNSTGSGNGQFFWLAGAADYGSAPGRGSVLVARKCWGDGTDPSGSALTSPQQNGLGYNGTEIQLASAYPTCQWQYGSSRSCWQFPVDTWVTYLLHFKLGRDNAAPNGATGGPTPTPPWRYPETTFELWVHDPSVQESGYIQLMSATNYVWFYGDGRNEWGRYYYNPPALNAFWMSQNFNDYIGGGSAAPPRATEWVDYTQAILSRNYIPPPSA